MIKKLLLPSILLSSIILVGCISASSHVLVGEKRAQIANFQTVQIVNKAPKVYTEIAIITATSAGSLKLGEQSKTDYVVELLKKEAAALGANGVLLNNLNDEAVSVPISDGAGGVIYTTGFNKTAKGLAIYITEY